MARRPTEPQDLPVPGGPVEITSALMSSVLGHAVHVVSVARVGAEFGFSGESYRVELDGSGGPAAVVVKLWSLDGTHDDRELRFYREMAAATPIRLPHFHHGGVDPASRRAWLVLEALDGFRQGDDLVAEPLETVHSLVEVLAGVHATWWGRVDERSWLPPARRLRSEGEYLTSRRVDFLERFGPPEDPLTAHLFDRIPTALEIAGKLLAGAPETLLHGDLGLDNVLFLQPGDDPVVIDWARCGRGAGVHDLAAILFGVAPLDRFSDVLAAYEAALASRGSAAGDLRELRRRLSGALVHEFVTRTLGVARWAATTPRGLEILDRWMIRTPGVLASWLRLDPAVFDHLG